MGACLMAAPGTLPIGYVFEFDPTGLSNAPDLSTAEKVREYFGYGTWETYGAGRVTVGAGGGYAVGSEGGEATHRLTETEMPKHNHEPINMNWAETSSTLIDSGGGTIWFFKRNGANPIGPDYITTAGGSSAHNNLQPYRTVYRWRRIA